MRHVPLHWRSGCARRCLVHQGDDVTGRKPLVQPLHGVALARLADVRLQQQLLRVGANIRQGARKPIVGERVRVDGRAAVAAQEPGCLARADELTAQTTDAKHQIALAWSEQNLIPINDPEPLFGVDQHVARVDVVVAEH